MKPPLMNRTSAVARPADDLADPMLRRRRRQEHSDPRSREFLRRLTIPGTAACLEIGAGLGSIARWLAAELAPRGQVLATETRPELVGLIGDPSLPNLQVIEHDIQADALPARQFDLIFTRYVLEHLPSRHAILARLAQALAPGGWLVIEDAVFDDSAPSGPAAYRDAMRAFADGKNGTDYTWAATLPAQMAKIGLHPISAQRIQDLFPSGSELALFFASVIAQEEDQTGQRDDIARTADREEAIALLTGGRAWFSGPVVVQCAGQADSSPVEKETKQT